MNYLALQKLWRRSDGRVPHMTPRQFEQAIALSLWYHDPRSQYWGIVDALTKTRRRSIVHCFNFGNLTVSFPWNADALNFGQRVPLLIAGSGTLRPVHTFRTLLHQIEAPFLIFTLDEASQAQERLQAGCIIVNAGEGEMRDNCEVVLLPESGPAPLEGVSYYYLTKRLTFRGEQLEPVSSPIDKQPLVHMRLHFTDPMVLDPGWMLLILEKDRYMWGVVTA